MIETWNQLLEEFIMLKLNEHLHPMAIEAWTDANAHPTPTNIQVFYRLAGMDRFYREFAVDWNACQKDYLQLSGPV